MAEEEEKEEMGYATKEELAEVKEMIEEIKAMLKPKEGHSGLMILKTVELLRDSRKRNKGQLMSKEKIKIPGLKRPKIPMNPP